ncbi:MAG: helix-turn-helix domain-containing protein [Fervidicoccaceae archaeon]
MKLSEKASSRLLSEIFEEVHNELKRTDFKYVKIEKPEKAEKRSIDIIAWSRGNNRKRIHLKITIDSQLINRDELRDLKGMSKASGSKPLIISEFERRIDLHDEVIYMKDDVPVINPITLSRLLNNSKELYVISKKGEFIVRISGRKMREKREELGYSLGEIAERLGVSRKAIYEYERNSFGVRIDYAEGLLELFGEDIVDPFDIFSHETNIEPSQVLSAENKTEKEIYETLREIGADIFSMKKTFFDLAARVGDRGILIGYESSNSPLTIEEKAEEFAKINDLKDLRKIIIVGEKLPGKESNEECEVEFLSKENIGSLKKLSL